MKWSGLILQSQPFSGRCPVLYVACRKLNNSRSSTRSSLSSFRHKGSKSTKFELNPLILIVLTRGFTSQHPIPTPAGRHVADDGRLLGKPENKGHKVGTRCTTDIRMSSLHLLLLVITCEALLSFSSFPCSHNWTQTEEDNTQPKTVSEKQITSSSQQPQTTAANTTSTSVPLPSSSSLPLCVALFFSSSSHPTNRQK